MATKMTFTDSAIQCLKHTDKADWCADKTYRGLGLCITAGSKTLYASKWDGAAQKSRQIKIGQFPKMKRDKAWRIACEAEAAYTDPDAITALLPRRKKDTGRLITAGEQAICGLHVPWNLRAIPWKLNRDRGDWFFIADAESDEPTDAEMLASFKKHDGDDEIPF